MVGFVSRIVSAELPCLDADVWAESIVFVAFFMDKERKVECEKV